MTVTRRCVVYTLLVTLVIAGCASPPERPLSTQAPPYALLLSGENPLTAEQVLRARTSPEERFGRPLQVLLLSGGGQNGAFGAGVLTGWQDSGSRPRFDAVTGISTGALMATFAFLGEPQDDEALAAIYTGIGPADVYEKQGILGRLLLGGSALMDSTPLKRLIDRYITAQTLARVAAEHDKGRMLLVGATNLDRNQLWVFQLDRLAREGGPQALETYRKILLAAASPPVAFPPVELFGYLFADGATVNNLLIAGLAGKSKRFAPSVPKGQIWLIHNGRMSSPAEATPVRRAIFPLIGKSLSISMDAKMDASIMRAYGVSLAHGYGFNLLEVPADVKMGGDALAFDRDEMVRLYDTGRALGRRNDTWAQEPPVTPEAPRLLIDAVKQLPPLLVE